ncbi:MAG: hypothetical protein SVV80_05990 [Planctomycetota bacterium]|nr:hypothetical protein [Planctomycetota bacterium]
MVIAHHLILTGYGHWLPNDPRGSMSLKTYAPELSQLAEAHFGRRKTQPPREELRRFYRRARKYLAYDVLWFNSAERQAIAEAIGEVIRRERLTCYACAVLTNHAHLLIRKHKLKGEEMSRMFKDAAREKLQREKLAPVEHPVFSADICDFYKSDSRAVVVCAGYIQQNFRKHNIPEVTYKFTTTYDGWPFRK